MVTAEVEHYVKKLDRSFKTLKLFSQEPNEMANSFFTEKMFKTLK
jgi:hypothetical protein